MSESGSAERAISWTHHGIHVDNAWFVIGGNGTCAHCNKNGAGVSLVADHVQTFVCNGCLLPVAAPRVLDKLKELLANQPPTPAEQLAEAIGALDDEDITRLATIAQQMGRAAAPKEDDDSAPAH